MYADHNYYEQWIMNVRCCCAVFAVQVVAMHQAYRIHAHRHTAWSAEEPKELVPNDWLDFWWHRSSKKRSPAKRCARRYPRQRRQLNRPRPLCPCDIDFYVEWYARIGKLSTGMSKICSAYSAHTHNDSLTRTMAAWLLKDHKLLGA